MRGEAAQRAYSRGVVADVDVEGLGGDENCGGGGEGGFGGPVEGVGGCEGGDEVGDCGGGER
jgi:hypothetical protein